MTKHYTTIGSVRGCCGHRHRSIDAAIACLDRDWRGCASQGGYSDRHVYEVDADGRRRIPTTTDNGNTIVDEGE